MSFLLPTIVLLASLHHDLVSFDVLLLHPALVPFSGGLIVGVLLLMVARKRLFSLSAYDILATKIVLLLQFLIVLQSITLALVDIVCIYYIDSAW